MNTNDLVKLTKVEAFNFDPDAIRVNYNLEGYLIGPIAVGNIINIWRVSRNGVRVSGHFTSTPVVKIDGNKIYTKNSIWQIEVLKEAKHNYSLGDIRFDDSK